MDDENILRAADIGQIFDAVANGFLSCTAAGNDPLQLVNTKLLGVCPQYLVPAVKANDLNGVDLGITLKAFQCIDNDRFVVYVQKLFGNVLLHSLPAAAGNDQCYVHMVPPFSPSVQIVSSRREMIVCAPWG